MILTLLILIPLFTGILTLVAPSKSAWGISLLSALATFLISLLCYSFFIKGNLQDLEYSATWISQLGARFSLSIDTGLPLLMVLLTGLAFPILILASQNKQPERSNTFFGLMLLAQAGLMGVFIAKDALLFYVFWEVALIPVYFLSSMFGGERRVAVTFKFFVYTFVGSLLMLVAFLYMYQQTPIKSFSWDSMISVGRSLPTQDQSWLFWLMFIAFAIKMPVFPFHTWQPDAYEQSSTPVTAVLSALMVKMGLFAVVTWLFPLIPDGSDHWKHLVIILSIIGIVYASCMAIVQVNIKRLVAYSSIAHIGLMCAAIFSVQIIGLQGAVVQMFNHGVNILGMWVLVQILEHRIKTQNLSEMGGIGKVAPFFTIALVLISFANIALPLTNGFVGEFMMFNGVYNMKSEYKIVLTALAGLGIILSAVYTLRMVQQVAFGSTNNLTSTFKDLTLNEKIVLILIMAIILWLGFYPKWILDLVNTTAQL